MATSATKSAAVSSAASGSGPADPAKPSGRAWPELSVPGAIYIAMTAFITMAAINVQANLLFAVAGLMVGVFFITESISRAMLSKLRVHRALPDFGVVGQRMALTYECANQKRFWPSLSVTVRELDAGEAFVKPPVAYMLHAAPHMAAVIATEVIPRRRGMHTLGSYQLSTSFPFGFIRRMSRGRYAETFVIYPAIARVDPKLLRLCMSAESSGASLRPQRGGADEFYGIKEYRRGENPRMIYWRRSARTGVLVSKEMTVVAPPRLLLIVDTRLHEDTPEEHALVEKTIAMAASLASHALEAGLLVGLCLWSNSWVAIPPLRGKRHREDLLSMLARTELNTHIETEELCEHAQEVVSAGTTQVLLTPHQRELGLAEQVRGRTVVLSPSSPQCNEWFEFSPAIDFAAMNSQAPPDRLTAWQAVWWLPRNAWRLMNRQLQLPSFTAPPRQPRV